jgi:uncharacterized protein YkwD
MYRDADNFDGKILERQDGSELNVVEGRISYENAIAALTYQDSIDYLEWSDSLALAARDHCLDIGASGSISHIGNDGSNVSIRADRYGIWGGNIGENLIFGDTGFFTGRDYAKILYIDDGVPGRGHRETMLNRRFTLTGVANCYHSVYGRAIVVTYAGSYIQDERGVEAQRQRL